MKTETLPIHNTTLKSHECSALVTMPALMRIDGKVRLNEIPVPSLTDDKDVLIRVAVAGVCRTDVYVADGRLETQKDPLILGHEFSGWIADTGSEVEKLSRGDRVTVMPVLPCGDCHECREGLKTRCQQRTMVGVDLDGAFAGYVVVPASTVYRLPDKVSLLDGAYAEPIAASLAVVDAGIQSHERGLVYGKNRIARLTQLILEAKGFEFVELGTNSLPADSFDFVIETDARQDAMADVLRAVRPGGIVVLKSRMIAPTHLELKFAVEKEIRLQGAFYGAFEEGLDLLATGKLQLNELMGDLNKLEDFEGVFAKELQGEDKKQFFLIGAEEDVRNH